jgi:hypothetical protein
MLLKLQLSEFTFTTRVMEVFVGRNLLSANSGPSISQCGY